MFLCERALLDLDTRFAIHENKSVIEIAEDGLEFWEWYSGIIRPNNPPRFNILDCSPQYSKLSLKNTVALWYSGGAESTFTHETIRKQNPDLLNINDFELFSGPHRTIGQIHFLSAVQSASLGYEISYLGVERNDLLLTPHSLARGFIERSSEFLERWSIYQPNNQIRSVCSHLYKEQIIKWLIKKRIRITGTCDILKGGDWCGGCFKCFEAYYSAKAVGLSLGFKLDPKKSTRFFAEFNRFIQSNFQDNYNNSYQHFVRLQICYHLEIDPKKDCW